MATPVHSLSSTSEQQASDQYPYRSLPEAYRACNFNPRAHGSLVFAICSDPHTGFPLEEPPVFPDEIIVELNNMSPFPDFFVVNGDITISTSLCFGDVPSGDQITRAIEEFTTAKSSLDTLNSQIALKLTLGNHDTFPYEKDAGLFRSVFGDQPVYESFALGGIHFFILNGGQSGDIDPVQHAWLKQEVARIQQNQTVIIFVHQPVLDRVVNERGIRATIKEVFASHTGQIWLIGGHHHKNQISTFRLPKTTITQAIITACNNAVWGDDESPGYWLYCLRDGQVYARIFRKLKGGYRLDPPPNLAAATPLPEPFAETTGRLQTIMIGDGDRDFLVYQNAADVVTWWSNIKDLVYRLPLTGLAVRPARLALLAFLNTEDPDQGARVFISPDNKNWEQLAVPICVNGVYEFPLPSTWQDEEFVYVRIIAASYGAMLGGMALCSRTFSQETLGAVI